MQQKQRLKTNFLTQEEWNLTPIRVKDLVVQQKLRIEEQSIKIEELEKQLQQLKEKQENLQEKVNCNSQNSSIPPSTELIKPEKKKPPKRKKRFRGGQLDHVGYSRPLYDESECTSIENHLLQTCKCCGEELSGLDENPYRHQVIKIPPIKPKIEEHRLHQLECHHCGEKTRAKLPEAISKSGYDPTVVALVAVMSGVYRHSHRMIVSAMEDFFGIRMALGTVNRLRKEASMALSQTVLEAKSYIQSSEKVCADETGFTQGNADGQNPTKKKAWLWVAVTPLISFFQVLLSRSTEAAMEDVLDIYHSEYDQQNPWLCFDESCKQLVKETKEKIPAEPGKPERYDYQYERNGVANMFMFFKPLQGWRHVEVTQQRTAIAQCHFVIDYAHQMKYLVDERYPDAEKIRVIQDNLNTHGKPLLYKAFEPKEAKIILDKLEFHYTPRHGSWLNMAEIELTGDLLLLMLVLN